MQSATRRRVSLSGCLAIGLTLLMLVIGLVSLLRPSGSGGPSFDTSPYALDLAKEAYQWRKNHRTTDHNFGNGAIILEYSDGSAPSVYPSPRYEGRDGPPDDINAFHSERLTHENYILPMLAQLRRNGILAKASRVDIIIFSQYHVCPVCQRQMRNWQDQQRCQAGSANVFLTIWELAQEFYPLARDPRKRPQPPVNDVGDIQTVDIPFVEQPTPVWTPTP